jgi:hypothetical protein
MAKKWVAPVAVGLTIGGLLYVGQKSSEHEDAFAENVRSYAELFLEEGQTTEPGNAGYVTVAGEDPLDVHLRNLAQAVEGHRSEAKSSSVACGALAINPSVVEGYPSVVSEAREEYQNGDADSAGVLCVTALELAMQDEHSVRVPNFSD